MKMYFTQTVAALMLFIPAIAMSQTWKSPQGENIALFINQSPIYASELQTLKQKKRGDAVAHFSSLYGPLPSGNFWQMCFNGNTPTQWIAQATTDELIEIHAQLALLQRYGITAKQLSYQDLKEKMLNENQKRSHAIANKQVVYGLAQFNFEKFKAHFLSVGFNKVRDKIKQQHHLSKEQLTQQYQQRKNKDFQESMTFSIQALKLTKSKNIKTTQLLFTLESELKTLQSQTLKEKYASHKNIGYLEKHFASESRKSDEFIWTKLINQVKHQKQGDVFQSTDIDGNTYLVKLSKKSQAKAQPLANVKHIIENDYAEQIYNQELALVIQKTKVDYSPHHKQVPKSHCPVKI